MCTFLLSAVLRGTRLYFCVYIVVYSLLQYNNDSIGWCIQLTSDILFDTSDFKSGIAQSIEEMVHNVF